MSGIFCVEVALGCHGTLEIVEGPGVPSDSEVPMQESDGPCSKACVWGWGWEGAGTDLHGTSVVPQSQCWDLSSYPGWKVELSSPFYS